MKMKDYFVYLLILILGNLYVTAALTEAEEITAHQVKSRFYLMPVSLWDTGNVQTVFKTAVAANATSICSVDLASCGLGAVTTFTAADVMVNVTSGLYYAEVTYYITFPTGTTLSSPPLTNYILTNSEAASALVSARESLYESLGYEVVKINGVTYQKRPDWLQNMILIPVTAAITIIVIVICLVCQCYERHQEKVEANALKMSEVDINEVTGGEHRERNRSTAKVSPSSITTEIENEEQPDNQTERSSSRASTTEYISPDQKSTSPPPPPPPPVANDDHRNGNQVTVAHGNQDSDNRLTPPETCDTEETPNHDGKKTAFENPAYIEVQDNDVMDTTAARDLDPQEQIPDTEAQLDQTVKTDAS